MDGFNLIGYILFFVLGIGGKAPSHKHFSLLRTIPDEIES
jgi:hypothetical protein